MTPKTYTRTYKSEPSVFATGGQPGLVTSIFYRSNITAIDPETVAKDVEKHKDVEGYEPDTYTATETSASLLHIKDSGSLTSAFIGLAYSHDDEIAILRQKDAKPEKYEAYNAFANLANTTAEEILPEV